jgi:hypothetical protein
MCVAKWSWGSKCKPFICSSLKLASKRRQDEMCYMFDVAKCDRIFDYLLQENQIKFPSGHVILSPEELKKHGIVNGIILILMLLMIAIFSVDRFNRP